MALYRRGGIWWFHYTFAGRHIQESAKTKSKMVAREAERRHRRELEEGFNGIEGPRKDRIRTIADLAGAYLTDYKVKHKAVTFAEYAVGHLTDHLGKKMLIQIDEQAVQDYQTARLKEKASPKSINEEVGFLLRIMGKEGAVLRAVLRREKRLALAVRELPGKAFSVEERDRMVAAARESRSPLILPALTLALNAGMRDGEIKGLRWSQIDFAKGILTVGTAKTAAGEGRTIPLNGEVREALTEHAKWYKTKFQKLAPESYVFPFGRRGKMDPKRPVTTLKTAWRTVRDNAAVKGRWHDNRHTLITELAESGAGDETIMAIAGHVSRRMLSRYSHIRTEAKRAALEDVLRRRQQAREAQDAKMESERAQVAPTVN